MPYITIRNIGPLVDTGRLKLTSLTLIIGKQSTGKSTLMKIISYCSWVEKRLIIGEDKFMYDYTHYLKFLKELMKFHRINEDEFSSDSYIEYESDWVKIEVSGNKRNAKLVRKPECKFAHNFKQSFIPSERNFLTSIQNIEKIYRTANIDNIFNFILEWRDAKSLFTDDKALDLVVTKGMKFYYDSKVEKEVLKLSNNKKISPFYASSGVQSELPLLVVANYLHSSIGTANYSAEDYALNKDINKFIYKSLRIFIEEPEQNLFPESQFELIKALFKIINKTEGCLMVLTSHSPYVLTSINLLIDASMACERNKNAVVEVFGDEVNLSPKAFSAYTITEFGTVENIIDEETNLIKGEYLDSISDTFDNMTYELNEIIYGDN